MCSRNIYISLKIISIKNFKLKNMNYAEQIDKVHDELIEQEGISINDLPDDIKKKIKGWNLLFARLTKNPEDEKLFRSLQKTSIQLADKIQDFIESDYDDSDDSDDSDDDKTPTKLKSTEAKADGDEKGDKTPAKPKSTEEKTDGDDKVDKTPANEPKPLRELGFGNLVMEKKIKQIISDNANDRIRVGQLRDVIGKEPEYPEQKVHTITLRKVFMSSEYRIV
jgi:hypothetical protein